MKTETLKTDILNLVTQNGVDAWIENGETFQMSHDMISVAEDGTQIFRTVYEKDEALYLLVDAKPDSAGLALKVTHGLDTAVDCQVANVAEASVTLNARADGFKDGELPRLQQFLKSMGR